MLLLIEEGERSPHKPHPSTSEHELSTLEHGNLTSKPGILTLEHEALTSGLETQPSELRSPQSKLQNKPLMVSDTSRVKRSPSIYDRVNGVACKLRGLVKVESTIEDRV